MQRVVSRLSLVISCGMEFWVAAARNRQFVVG
jgi:hypothetical protein